MSAFSQHTNALHEMHPLRIPNVPSSIERQRDHFMKSAAKWQLEYLAMKAERDALAELLKIHHQARKALHS